MTTEERLKEIEESFMGTANPISIEYRKWLISTLKRYIKADKACADALESFLIWRGKTTNNDAFEYTEKIAKVLSEALASRSQILGEGE